MCSYCGCRSISVIGRYSAEHDQIVNALGVLRRAAVTPASADRGVPAAVGEAAEVLRGLLDPHTESEERGLFRELRQDPDFTEHVDALCAEHGQLHGQLDAVARGELDRLPELEHLLRHHIDREENGLFPAAAIALDGPAWERVTEASV